MDWRTTDVRVHNGGDPFRTDGCIFGRLQDVEVQVPAARRWTVSTQVSCGWIRMELLGPCHHSFRRGLDRPIPGYRH